MLFVTLAKIRPGKSKEALKLFKAGKFPDEIAIKANLGLFGHYDGLLIFEATDSAKAAEFVTNITDVFETETFAAVPPREIWPSKTFGAAKKRSGRKAKK
jgi:hypothetical protein